MGEVAKKSVIAALVWQDRPNQFEGDINYNLVQTDVGQLFAAETSLGLCQLSFVSGNSLDVPLKDLEKLWPRAFYHHRALQFIPEKITFRELLRRPMNLHLCATPFQRKVWQALLAIPVGKVANYGGIAKLLHQPRASQAVGQAVGANPLAIIVPCHRVISGSGAIGHYHWGAELKERLLQMERRQVEGDKPLL